jgi:adenine phosphoribosyltransferase
LVERLTGLIAEYPDFPIKGILFRDLNPIYQDAEAFKLLIAHMAEQASAFGEIDYITGIEARGFILGAALAQALHCGFFPMRKKGKLPGELHTVEYDLEYGKDCLQIQDNDKLKNARILIIDDVFATGGTMRGAVALLKQMTKKIFAGVVMDIGISNIQDIGVEHFVVLPNCHD